MHESNLFSVVESQFPSDAALGAKRQQDKIPFEKLQKHPGAHQQHQKTSQVSKAQFNCKTTLKGIEIFTSTKYFFLPSIKFLQCNKTVL